MTKVKKIISFVITIVMTLSVFNFYVFNHQVKAATNISSNRLSGNDRCETAAKIAQAGWKSTSDYAIISTAKDFPDALCAAPLAKKYNAPILLTNSDSLNDYAKAELLRLHVKNAIIIGGTGVIYQNTEDQIKALGINTIRIAGSNRYETSEKIAEQIGSSKQVVIATGEDFPDALSIAPIAAMKGMPILLTERDFIPNEITPYLKSNSFTNTYVIGGAGVISDSVLSKLQNPVRISGNNRYDTNMAVINQFKSDLNQSTVYMATGDNFPDALACSALASTGASPLLLINDNPPVSTKTYIKNNDSIANVNVVGGTGVISDNLVQNEINDSWSVSTPTQESGEIVTFKDKKLENAVRKAIKKQTGDLYTSDVENIKELTARFASIKYLDGIENLRNLQKLDLGIGDCSYDCNENQITDISALSGLTNLVELNLGGNSISNLNALKGLINLKKLSLNYNNFNLSNDIGNLSNIDALSRLTNLVELDLGGNQISDISALKGLSNLKILSLSDTNITDISALSGLTNLVELDLCGSQYANRNFNSISSLSPLSGLTNLVKLRLGGQQISDISALKGLTNLKTLSLFYNDKISDITPLSGLTNLTSIDLNLCENLSNLSPLSGLTNLTNLTLTRNGSVDANALKGLTNLKTLDLFGSPVMNLSALSGLTNLTDLNLGGGIADISVLKNLTNLQKLTLSVNVNDLSPLSGLANLTELNLVNTKINDIAPLKGLTNLQRIFVSMGRIKATDLDSLQKALPKCKFEICY